MSTSRRRRALRAARAVTLSLTLGAGATGCGMSHGPRFDGGESPADAGLDASADASLDAGQDAGPECSSWGATRECCEAGGGFWSEGGGCAVPGPFVPPDLPA